MKIIATMLATIALASTAYAADYTLVIKDHKFDPAKLEVTANEKHTITVKNMDSTPAEFESHELKREKVIKGGGEAVIKVGPLKPGNYPFFEEFHEDTTKGVLIAK